MHGISEGLNFRAHEGALEKSGLIMNVIIIVYYYPGMPCYFETYTAPFSPEILVRSQVALDTSFVNLSGSASCCSMSLNVLSFFTRVQE